MQRAAEDAKLNVQNLRAKHRQLRTEVPGQSS
jgi:hypothetical protein